MLVHLYSHTGWMGVILLAAGKSQWIGPALVKKLAAVKDDVEVAAAATMMYKENDNEHGTLQLITSTRHANGLHTYVKFWTWSVLSCDGVFLSGGITPQSSVRLCRRKPMQMHWSCV